MGFSILKIEEVKIGIIGLGYVGLPLAVEFGKLMPTVGFDINANRIAELNSGKDNTHELDAGELSELLDERDPESRPPRCARRPQAESATRARGDERPQPRSAQQTPQVCQDLW